MSKYACDKGGTCGGGCNLMMAQPYAAVSVLCSSLLTVFALVLADFASPVPVIHLRGSAVDLPLLDDDRVFSGASGDGVRR